MSISSIKLSFLIVIFSSCVLSQETLTWTNDIPIGGWPGTTLGPHSNNSECHSRGTLTSLIANPSGFTMPFGTPLATTTNNNSLVLGMSGVPNTQGITQTLTFSYPVENLTFSIFDIDGTAGSWQDRLVITGTLAGNPVPITITTCPTAAGVVCLGSGTNTARIDAGTTPTGFTAANGRGDITINGALDSVTILYQNHTVPTSTTQFISITQLTYNCAIVGIAKLMTRRAGQAFGVSPYIVDIDFNFENFGDVTLSNISAIEDLDAVFNVAPNVGNYAVTSVTKTSGPAGFSVNAAFNGNSDQQLISGGSSLTPTQTASMRVTLNVLNYGSYTNSIIVDATTPQSATTSDTSTDGTNPDGADADSNPDELIISALDTSTLPVSLNYFSSHLQNDQQTIEWQTDIEFNHLGFEIYQQDLQGNKTKVSDLISQPKQQLNGALKTYSLTINSIHTRPIWLAEYSKKGIKKWYGPFNQNVRVGSKILNAQRDWQTNSSFKNLKTNTNELALEVSKTGMHRISYQDLIQAGLNLAQASPQELSIQLSKTAVPVSINGNAIQFDATTSFDFYAETYESLYTNKRIYHLSFDGHEQQIQQDNTQASGVIKSWYWQTDAYNPNNYYDFSSATQDPWHADLLATYSTANKSIDFPLDEKAEGIDEAINLKLELSGALDYQLAPSNYPTDPNRCGANHLDVIPGIPNDHCLKINVNGAEKEDLVFDGLINLTHQYQLDSDVTATGVVNINLDLTGETGFAYDAINIEEISVTYPRNLSAITDALQFQLADSARIHNDFIGHLGFEAASTNDEIHSNSATKAAIEIDEFSDTNIVAFALNPQNPIKINNIIVKSNAQNNYSVLVPAIANNDKYWVSTEGALLKPHLTPWHSTQSIYTSNADYLIISHPDFMQTILQLKSYHESQGLNVALVNIEDIYAKYSQSIISPDAIKDFIKDSAQSNKLKYVLLVGADNYDYKAYLSNQHISYIPTFYVATDDVVRYAPTDSLFADLDDDKIPDLAIGRFPVNNNQELQLIIDKQMDFINQADKQFTSHFIADAQDVYNSYATISNELQQLLPNSWSSLTSYRDDFIDENETKQQIINNFAQNPKLTTYLGHSGPRNWFSFPSALTYNDISSLPNNTAASVIVQWGCWNSYYVEPDANTMAHKFLFNGENGGVAVLGASALTTVVSEKAFAQLLIPELTKNNSSIGEAMTKAKIALAKKGQYDDIVLGWNLLGDPALRLNHD